MDTTLLLLIAVLSFGFHLLLIRFAPVLKLIDIPNDRSMHKKPIPRGAGIAISASVLISQSLFNTAFVLEHILVFIAIALVFLIGLIDDRYDTSPRIKLLVIFAASALVYAEGISIDTVGTYLGYNAAVPALLLLPFTFFAIAGFTNALNLIDGLDGLAASVSLIMLSTFFAIGLHHHDVMIITLSSSFIIATAVFWMFNWNPAKIFMGDSGSLTLGFVISVLSILSIRYATPTSILFIIAVPLLDTFIVMTRRIQRKQSPFKADRNHLHHFLVNLKGDVRFSVILIASIQAIFSIIGYQLRDADDLLSLVLFSLLFFVFLNMFDQRIRRRKKSKKTSRRKSDVSEQQKAIIAEENTQISSPLIPTYSEAL